MGKEFPLIFVPMSKLTPNVWPEAMEIVKIIYDVDHFDQLQLALVNEGNLEITEDNRAQPPRGCIWLCIDRFVSIP